MSAKLTHIPAEEFEREYCAEELAEERKADKRERGRVSSSAMAFTSLLEAGGVSPDVYQAVHVFLGKTKNHAPEEPVLYFSEKEAGETLPGEADVAHESFRKRFVRAWRAIEEEQIRTGKRFCGLRKRGSIQLASRIANEKKKAPEYFSQIAQAVVDVERSASRMRGKREERFRRAALEVWAKLPDFYASDVARPEAKETPKNEAAHKETVKKFPRRLERFTKAAREMLTEAKKRDAGAVEATGKELVLELGKMLAEALDVEPESALLLLADTLTEAAEAPEEPVLISEEESSLELITGQGVDSENEKVRATNFFEDSQVPEQKRDFDSSHVDSPVHVEPLDGDRPAGASISPLQRRTPSGRVRVTI